MAIAAAPRLGFITALRASGAGAPFAASLIGRLPMGAIGLVFILRTHDITGSFAAGGLATGAYALSLGLVGPGVGRLIDLKGQTFILLAAGTLQASALTAFAILPGDAILPVTSGSRRSPARRSHPWARPSARSGTATSTTRCATCCSPASPPCSRRSTSPARC